MENMTLEKWESLPTLADFDLNGTTVLPDGRAEVTFLRRANHHGSVCRFIGEEAVIAERLLRIAKAKKGVQNAKNTLAYAERLLESIQQEHAEAAQAK